MPRKPVKKLNTKSKRTTKDTKSVKWDAMVSKKEPKHLKTRDSFSNLWANIGFGSDSLLEKTEYPLTRLTENFNLMTSLYRDNWVVQNIVRMVPEDTCKNWYKIKGDITPDEQNRWNRTERATQLKKKIIDGISWGRLYGGAVGIILIEGQMDKLAEPLDIKSIALNSFKGLLIIDRWTGAEPDIQLIDDITKEDYGLPEYYNINNAQGNVIGRVHSSRVVRFIGRELPTYEKIANRYWGESEIEAVYREVIKRDNTSENIANLVFKANLSVREIENLNQLFAVGGTQAQIRFWNVIKAQELLESNFGIKAIEKGENYRHEQYSFAGLPEVYNSIMMDLSGATHIPVTKLFGRSPGGLNATGESDLQNYYDFLEKTRAETLEPIINKLLPIMQMSVFGQLKDIDVEYSSPRSYNEQEKSNLVSQNSQAILQAWQTGAITQKVTLKELSQLSEQFGIFSNISEDDIVRAQDKTINEMQQMNDPMSGLFGSGYEGSEESEGNNTEEQPQTDSVEEPQTKSETLLTKANELLSNINNNESGVIEEQIEGAVIIHNEPETKFGGVDTSKYNIGNNTLVNSYTISEEPTISDKPIQEVKELEDTDKYNNTEPIKGSNTLINAINNLLKIIKGE